MFSKIIPSLFNSGTVYQTLLVAFELLVSSMSYDIDLSLSFIRYAFDKREFTCNYIRDRVPTDFILLLTLTRVFIRFYITFGSICKISLTSKWFQFKHIESVLAKFCIHSQHKIPFRDKGRCNSYSIIWALAPDFSFIIWILIRSHLYSSSGVMYQKLIYS